MNNEELAKKVLSLIDLTSLNNDDTPEIIDCLCKKAVNSFGHVAAVCVYPKFVAQAKKLLNNSPVKIATVTNFPTGGQPLEDVLAQTKTALMDGADEIDMVIPYQAYLAGEQQVVKNYITASKKVCGTKALKVILETGALADSRVIAEVSRIAILAGADFLKTSTGKISIGATLEAAQVMLEAIKESGKPVGFKASGGVKTVKQAADYLYLAEEIMGEKWVSSNTMRFGASSLLDDILIYAK